MATPCCLGGLRGQSPQLKWRGEIRQRYAWVLPTNQRLLTWNSQLLILLPVLLIVCEFDHPVTGGSNLKATMEMVCLSQSTLATSSVVNCTPAESLILLTRMGYLDPYRLLHQWWTAHRQPHHWWKDLHQPPEWLTGYSYHRVAVCQICEVARICTPKYSIWMESCVYTFNHWMVLNSWCKHL